MASSWAVSTYPEDVKFTYNWTIEDFNKAMERTGGKIDSSSFKMPGLKMSFYLRIKESLADGDPQTEPKHQPRELIDVTETLICIFCPFGPMPNHKTMRTKCLNVFSVTWVPKLLLPPDRIRSFGQKTVKFGQKLAFLVIFGQILAFFARSK